MMIQNKNSNSFRFSVLGPITSVAKLKLNMNPELDSPPFEVPKVDLYFEMEKLAVGITRAQYQRLIELADGMGAMNRGIPYRKFRPFETRKCQFISVRIQCYNFQLLFSICL